MDDLIFNGWNSIKCIHFEANTPKTLATAKADQRNVGQIVYKSHLPLLQIYNLICFNSAPAPTKYTKKYIQQNVCSISMVNERSAHNIKHSVHIRVHNPWQWTNIELLTIFKVKFRYVIWYRETSHFFASGLLSSSANKNLWCKRNATIHVE